MKTIEAAWTVDCELDVEGEVVSFDWKEDPESTMELVDAALSKFGLEVVSVDTGSDQYTFVIRRVEEKS